MNTPNPTTQASASAQRCSPGIQRPRQLDEPGDRSAGEMDASGHDRCRLRIPQGTVGRAHSASIDVCGKPQQKHHERRMRTTFMTSMLMPATSCVAG